MRMSGAIDSWDWEGGIAMVGLMYAYEATGDVAILDHVQTWMGARLAEGIPLSSPAYRDPDCATGAWPDQGVRHPNHAAPAWALMMLYEHRPLPAYRSALDDTVDFLTYRACRVDGVLAHQPGQLWDDTLAMSVPLLARYAVAFDRPDVLDLAVDETLGHASVLQDPASGLWYHGWDEMSRSHMSAAHWCRGNGWAALATTELLRVLPADDPDAARLWAEHLRQLHALAEVQSPGGMWRTVVDRPDFYLETSGSAAITAALIGTQVLDAGDPDAMALAAAGRRGLVAAYGQVAPDGAVRNVSTGTGVAATIEYYNTVPHEEIKPYGQGLWLMMASAAPKRLAAQDRLRRAPRSASPPGG